MLHCIVSNLDQRSGFLRLSGPTINKHELFILKPPCKPSKSRSSSSPSCLVRTCQGQSTDFDEPFYSTAVRLFGKLKSHARVCEVRAIFFASQQSDGSSVILTM